MCLDCLSTLQESAALKDIAHARCPGCGDMFYSAEKLKDWSFPSMQIDADEVEAAKKQKKRANKKAKSNNPKEEDTPSWLHSAELLPSSKTVAIKAQILNWFEDHPNCKVIIYTQFIMMVYILKRMCTQELWGSEEVSSQLFPYLQKSLTSYSTTAK
jgi:hypothetical protein